MTRRYYCAMDNNDTGASVRVYQDGYVDYENTDAQFASEEAAIKELEDEGYIVVGWDKD